MPPQTDKQAYSIRISHRAKHARITINSNLHVEVVLPLGVPKREAAKLFKQQQPWITRTLLRMQQHAPKVTEPKLPEKVKLRALEESIPIAYHASDQSGFSELDGVLSVYLSSKVNSDQEQAHQAGVILRTWLKVRAKNSLPEWLQSVALEMNADYRAVSIRLQKTRWGSCSTLGNINLNAKLLLFPPDIVRYVLVHELAHLKHMNHSPAFWQYLAQFEPNFRNSRQKIRTLSISLPAWSNE